MLCFLFCTFPPLYSLFKDNLCFFWSIFKVFSSESTVLEWLWVHNAFWPEDRAKCFYTSLTHPNFGRAATWKLKNLIWHFDLLVNTGPVSAISIVAEFFCPLLLLFPERGKWGTKQHEAIYSSVLPERMSAINHIRAQRMRRESWEEQWSQTILWGP